MLRNKTRPSLSTISIAKYRSLKVGLFCSLSPIHKSEDVLPMYPNETRWECSVSYPDVEYVSVAAMLYVSRQHHACAPPHNILQETR